MPQSFCLRHAAGKIAGRLYMIDWYPGVIAPAGPHDGVTGDIFELGDSPKLLRKLDDYEGPEFERVIATAFLPDGAGVPCWLYRYRGRVREEQRIHDCRPGHRR